MYIDLDWQKMELGPKESCMIKPLETEAYQRVMTYFKSSGITEAQATTELGVEKAFDAMSNSDMFSLIQAVLPAHVKDVQGIQFKFDGVVKKATVEDLVKHSQFVVINVQILGQLIAISSIAGTAFDEDAEKEAEKTPEEVKKQETETSRKELPGQFVEE